MNQDNFKITKEKNPNNVKLTIRGRLDIVNADLLQIELNELMKEKPDCILLNMSHVIYLSSAGLKVVLKTYKDAKNAGSILGIEMPSEKVLGILEMTALERLLISNN